jgi:hypothetical protein
MEAPWSPESCRYLPIKSMGNSKVRRSKKCYAMLRRYAVLRYATVLGKFGSLGPDPSQLGKDLTSCKAWSAFSGAPLWKQALMRPNEMQLQHAPATTEKNKEKRTRSNDLHFRCKTLQDSATKAESLSSPHVHSFESNCIVPAWQLKNKVDIHHTGFLHVTTNVNTILYTTSTQRLHHL